MTTESTTGNDPIYPQADRRPETELWHGLQITDEYRWLEKRTGTTKRWITRENELTESYFASSPDRLNLHEDLTGLLEPTGLSCPQLHNGSLFQWRHVGLENEPRLFRTDPDGTSSELFDMNELIPDEHTAVSWTSESPDWRYVAYGIAENDDELTTLHIRDLETGRDIPDVIPFTQHCSIAWLPDGTGFYYSRHDDPAEEPDDGQYHRSIYFHAFGTDWHEDPVIFTPSGQNAQWLSVQIANQGTHVRITVSESLTDHTVYAAPLDTDSYAVPDFKLLFAGHRGHTIIEEHNGMFYILTNAEAPNKRLLRINTGADDWQDEGNWEEIVPESGMTLKTFGVLQDRILLLYNDAIFSRILFVDPKTGTTSEMKLPGPGVVEDASWETGNTKLYYKFSSCTDPGTIYTVDLHDGIQDVFQREESPINHEHLITEYVTYTSDDGTPLGMLVLRDSRMPLDGSAPMIMEGYGGFNAGVRATYDRYAAYMASRGYIYAKPLLRGGDEFGRGWYEQGRREYKQNTFDDFYHAAVFAIEQGYTSVGRLGIYGGSNGGLLVGAAITQHPELFRAAVCDVPILDMVHFPITSKSVDAIDEYGDPRDPDQFKYLYAYSPYHHANPAEYPAVYLTAGSNDSRVKPADARKMAARLQAVNRSKRNILYREMLDLGHGQDMQMQDKIDYWTDVFAFFMRELSS